MNVHHDVPRSASVVTQLVTHHPCPATRIFDVAGDLHQKAEVVSEVRRIGAHDRELGYGDSS